MRQKKYSNVQTGLRERDEKLSKDGYGGNGDGVWMVVFLDNQAESAHHTHTLRQACVIV